MVFFFLGSYITPYVVFWPTDLRSHWGDVSGSLKERWGPFFTRLLCLGFWIKHAHTLYTCGVTFIHYQKFTRANRQSFTVTLAIHFEVRETTSMVETRFGTVFWKPRTIWGGRGQSTTRGRPPYLREREVMSIRKGLGRLWDPRTSRELHVVSQGRDVSRRPLPKFYRCAWLVATARFRL